MKGCQSISVPYLLFVISLCGGWLFCTAVADSHGLGCRTLRFAKPVNAFALHGHVIENISLHLPLDDVRFECRSLCGMESTCVSINIVLPGNDGVSLCQLSNSDHIRHPEDLKPQEGFLYWATKNPCSSDPCLYNATCLNGFTDKRYMCVCQVGYRGEHCETDIDECVSGEYDCHRFASCKNTVGSYSCSCVPHFTGDGKACTQTAPECTNYQTLTNGDRKTTAGGGGGCDSTLGPGWFRFLGDAGTKMPISCVPSGRCGTDAPGWLNGAHPTVAEGQVTRQVCFSWTVCCQWAINVYVRNCSDFLVYYINQTPPEHRCHLRYCGTV